MSQFTNNYNGQNGMMMQQMPQPMPSGQNYQQPMIQTPVQMPQNNVVQSAQQQGWKTFSPAPPPKPVMGRWVTTFDDIKPQDVPMDGSVCLFPQEDYSCIYAMVWSNNGQIVPYRFLPEKNETQVNQTAQAANVDDLIKAYEMMSDNVARRLDSFSRTLDDILAATQTKSTRNTKSVDKEDK